MSREERKMAQIIASIERMEQRKAATPSSTSSRADSSNAESDGNASSSNTTAATLENNRPKMERMNSSEIHAQVQKSTRLGAKGKKLKPLSTSHGVKVRSGSKKVKKPQELVVNKREIVDCKLTPKKRWIQLWNEQLSTSDESTDGDKMEVQQEPEKEKEPSRETAEKDHVVNKPQAVEVKIPETPLKPMRPTITQEEEDPLKEEGEEDDDEEGAVKVVRAEQILAPASPQADEQKEVSISPVSSVKETSKDAAAAIATQEKKEERNRTAAAKSIPALDSRRVSKKTKPSKKTEAPVISSSDSDDTKKAAARKLVSTTTTTSGSDDNLRVKTPQVIESSHLSPPLDQHSPAAAASISPSAKKDAETANSAETTSPSEESVRSSSPARSQHEAKASPDSPIPRKDMADLISKPRDGSKKRSLERKESEPLTEEERRRAERRRKRKSNWDVGDPRFASRNGERQTARSPSSDGNSPSRKFPPGRPSWRHSNSMDATYSSKSSFQNNSNNASNRSSFSGGSSGPARRGFYSSNSLPLDRSRSAGRSSSSRYNYSNSNNNSYR